MSNKAGISKLRYEEMQLHKEIQHLTNQITEINTRIKNILNTEPICSSCGRHRLKEDMVIVTEDIINNHEDTNEGHGPLSLGEYYCGC